MGAEEMEAMQSTVDALVEGDADNGLVARIIQQSVDEDPESIAAIESVPVQGLAVVRVVGFQGSIPQLLIEFDGEYRIVGAVAVTGSLNPQTDVGQSVCVSFDRNDRCRPVVLGKIVSGLPQNDVPASSDVQITSDSQIVLRCGKASISLKSDGTVAIRGTNVASRASATNRIRGGNVQIN